MAPRKKNQPQLTQEQIVEAAMKLIDEHGLEGHSMRQLGGELGVDASSIYYYVPSKSVLYDLIVDEVLRGVDLSIDDLSRSVEDRLVTLAQEYRRALLVHPKTIPLIAARSLRTPVQLRPVEGLLGIFFDAGFSTADAIVAVDSVGQCVAGMTIAYAAHLTESQYHRDNEAFAELPAEEFPLVNRVFAEGTHMGFDFEFERGIRAIVKGLLAMHEAGTLGPSVTDRVDR